MPLVQDFAEDLRNLFAKADALDMGPLMQPGVDPQAAAASMASDAGVNNLLLQVWQHADTHTPRHAASVGTWSSVLCRPVWHDLAASCIDLNSIWCSTKTGLCH